MKKLFISILLVLLTTIPVLAEETPSKNKIVLLANSIDYSLAADFHGFLRNNGIEVIYTTVSDFSQYENEKFIVILGGQNAPEGVGDIVKTVLTEDEQASLLASTTSRKMFVKTNVWSHGQVVMILAGYEKEQTQLAHIENKEKIHKKVKNITEPTKDCYNITVDTWKRHCYYEQAILNRDSTLCDKIEDANDTKIKQICYAVINEDIKLCDQIVNDTFNQVLCNALVNNDYNMCDSLEYPIKENCRYYYMLLKKDIELCGKIGISTYRGNLANNGCNYLFGIDLGDLSFCNAAGSKKDGCYAEYYTTLGVSENNESHCKNVPSIYRSDCVKSVQDCISEKRCWKSDKLMRSRPYAFATKHK